MPHPRLEGLTPADVRRAARRIEPKDVRKWGVIVDGQEFPVKQVLLEAANLVDVTAPKFTPADFISHTAVHKLKKLGFEVRYHEDS